jgi:rare lipoprotein A
MRRYFAPGFVWMCAFLTFPVVTQAGRPAPIIPGRASPGGAWTGERGTASYYGPGQDGRLSASGVRFNQRLLTAAHPWLPFGTRVRVTLGETGRSVIVTITDRLPSSRRILDLSVAAARELGIIRRGIAEVTLTPV